ncbi:MAG: formylglycine-generating enzyme family protein [Anaerolineales bacterium]|nr:formylglycine-generating enzyme family protein [Anaerolineales bacterium]
MHKHLTINISILLACMLLCALSACGSEPAPGTTAVSPADGMVQVYVPGGSYDMGSDSGDRNEQPVHRVILSPYWMDLTEVTNAMYATCVAAGACTPPVQRDSATRTSYYGNDAFADYPVISVTWAQVQVYCKWAERRLPTEAEWEYAARGSDGRDYPWGNQIPDGTQANYCERNCPLDWADEFADMRVDDGYADTAPVGSYPAGASPFGIWDMAGNVWEWVNDVYGAYGANEADNPQGPASGSLRVLRGGSWLNYDGFFLRTTLRNAYDSSAATGSIGFRCASSTAP